MPINAANVTLIWDPNNEPDIAGYKFYYGTESRVYTKVTDVFNHITNTVSGLSEGTTYFFAVSAYNMAGLESDFSNEVSYTPAAPTNQVNQPPTIDLLTDLSLNEDASQQTVLLTGISSGVANENQGLTVIAVSDNPNLVPDPSVSYVSPSATGTLGFAPVANGNGVAHVTVIVDDGGATNSRTTADFTVSVNAVNDPPTLDPIGNQVISGNAGAKVIPLTGISSGAPNESQALVLTAISDNPALIGNPGILYTNAAATATLTLAPASNSSGSAMIKVTVNDGGGTNNTLVRAFMATVNSSNQPPSISAIPNTAVQKNQSTAAIPFTIGDPETPASGLVLTGSSTSSNLVPLSQLVFGGGESNRTATITPTRGKIGTTFITIGVSDSVVEASTTFLLTVLGSGSAALFASTVSVDPPTITSIGFDAVEGTTIEWESTPGATYRVQSKDNLEQAIWRDLSGNIVAEDQVSSWIDGTAQGKSSSFYLITSP